MAGFVGDPQLGGTRTMIGHAENVRIETLKAQETQLQELPQLPARDVLPVPGQPPAGSRIIYSRNQAFVGREEDLNWLAERLLYAQESQSVGISPAVAATGLGGIGKTQLAVEFCYRYGRYFEGVHWVSGIGGDLIVEIVECGRTMGLLPWPEKIEDQLARTLFEWSHSQRRLVVLDNLEDPAMLRQWLAKLTACRVLVTSRRPAWPADLGLQECKLGLLSPVECLALLRDLAPRLDAVSEDRLTPVAERLGGLALAVDLAGRYLNDRENLTSEEYLGELNEAENLLVHTSLLDWVTNDNPTRHETSLAATFSLSWKQLEGGEADKIAARKIFELAGWCAPNTVIPGELLSGAAGVAEIDFDRGMKWLYELGLLERTKEGPVIHPLLAEFSRSMSPVGEKRNSVLGVLADTLSKQVNETHDSGFTKAFRTLISHLEQICPVVDDIGLAIAGSLWNSLGLSLSGIVRFEAAKTCFERALAIDEAAYGPNHSVVARDVNDLGRVLRELGDLAGAKQCFKRALAIAMEAYGTDHPNVAWIVYNLAEVLREQGDLAGAKQCFKRALAIAMEAYGTGQPDIAWIVNNLAELLREQGDLTGAKECYEQALAIIKGVYGQDHP
ncbi:MAG: tetratricopeptide repeat protein, partial [Anaerolineaceae bacterium]|nr:tetratricopeptide repeat protein [Anaerolineaceae bacterium]